MKNNIILYVELKIWKIIKWSNKQPNNWIKQKIINKKTPKKQKRQQPNNSSKKWIKATK